MLSWIGQKFKKKSQSNSLTDNQLDQAEEKLPNLDLTDNDYEFLFNQLLEGVAHGWHQVRIVKFFDQLEERGETEKWVAWLKRFSEKLPTSPNPIQRQFGARMIRLGELTQSHKKLQAIGAISDEVGRKLFFGDVEELIWEYDGIDIVSLPSSETNPSPTANSNLSTPPTEPESSIEDSIILDKPEKWASIEEDDSEPTVIQTSFLPSESEELVLETQEEFPFVPEDGSEPTVIQTSFLPSESEELVLETEEEFPFVPEDGSEPTVIQNSVVPNQSTGLSFSTEEFPLELEEDSESPWEQPELIAAIPELTIEEVKPKSHREDFDPDSLTATEIPEISSEKPDNEAHRVKQLANLPQPDQKLEEPPGEKLDIVPFATESTTQPPPLERSPKNLETSELLESWFELGLKQASVGDLEKAIASWDKVLEFNPELAEVWHNRGSALGRMGKYEESVISFDRALEIEPNHYQAWNDRAHALYLMEKWQEAVDSWNKTIAIMPNNHQFWYNRGCALEKLNLIEEAIASHEKALEIQPDFEPAKSKYLSLLTDT